MVGSSPISELNLYHCLYQFWDEELSFQLERDFLEKKKNRFQGWEAGEFDLTYTMRSIGEYMRGQKDRKELVLMNYEKTVENLEV